MEIRHIKGENASVAKATMSMMYDHLCNCVASSDCETETETIYSAQSRETSAANEIKSEVESNQEEDESDEDKETDYDIAEYEPESCNEAERPPQVRPDTGRFSCLLSVASLGFTSRLTFHSASASARPHSGLVFSVKQINM